MDQGICRVVHELTSEFRAQPETEVHVLEVEAQLFVEPTDRVEVARPYQEAGRGQAANLASLIMEVAEAGLVRLTCRVVTGDSTESQDDTCMLDGAVSEQQLRPDTLLARAMPSGNPAWPPPP